MTAGKWVVHALDQASAQWEHFAEATETATRQRDEALAALKAAREALEPFARISDLIDSETEDSSDTAAAATTALMLSLIHI